MAVRQPHYVMPENPPLAMRQKMTLKAYFNTLPMADKQGNLLSADDKLAGRVLQNAAELRSFGVLPNNKTPVTAAEVFALFAGDGLPDVIMDSFEGEMRSAQFLAKHEVKDLAGLLKKAPEVFTLAP